MGHGLSSPRPADSPRSRDGNCIPCIGRWILSMDHQESPSACLSEGFAQTLSRQAPCTSKRRLKLVLPGCQCFDIRCVSTAATVFAPEDALEEDDPVGWKPSELRMRLCPLGFGGPCANLQNLGQHSTQPISAPAGPTDTCTQACLQLRCHHALPLA